MAQSYLGNILHKGQALAAKKVAAAVKLTAGMAVYQDGANGLKVVPIATPPPANSISFIENEQDNLTGALGGKESVTWGSGTVMVVLADGSIPIDSKLKAGTAVAGRLEALADPANATLGDAAEINTVRDWMRNYLADYLGHVDEYRLGKDPTAATVGQEIVMRVR